MDACLPRPLKLEPWTSVNHRVVLGTEVRSSAREGTLTADPALRPEDSHSSDTEHAK